MPRAESAGGGIAKRIGYETSLTRADEITAVVCLALVFGTDFPVL
jgi:hypothetical protein